MSASRGSRMHAAYFRAGGVHQDMPPGLADDIMKFCEHFPKVLDDIEGLLTENRIFKQRNVDIGVINRAEAEMWGMSGVMLRSTGVKWDLRRTQPYECYNELDFKIPVGKNGDNYDRYVMRMEEMREATKIMKQCLEKMTAGAGGLGRPQGHAAAPRRDEDLDGGPDPSLQALYRRLPCARPARSMPRWKRPRASSASIWWPMAPTSRYRCKIRAPSYVHLQAMDYMCKGHMLADVSAVLGSLDIVFGEVDR